MGTAAGLGWGWVASVDLVDQLFQPTWNPLELVENDGYQPYHNHGLLSVA